MKMRGDLSAPVLAILVTIGIIAAGLVLLAWFWWFAPTAGRAGSLQILGQPVLDNTTKRAYISVKNTGNDAMNITGVVVGGITCSTTPPLNITLGPGGSIVINATCTGLTIGPDKYVVNGIIYTTYGTYTVSLAVIRSD